jgi:hypothetical protein
MPGQDLAFAVNVRNELNHSAVDILKCTRLEHPVQETELAEGSHALTKNYYCSRLRIPLGMVFQDLHVVPRLSKEESRCKTDWTSTNDNNIAIDSRFQSLRLLLYHWC